MAKQDYYELLGVTRHSSHDEIKAAYRKQAIKYHPDKNPGDKQAEEKFKSLNEAYSVLSDSEKRKMYDQFGHAAVDGSAGTGPGGFRGGAGFEGFGGLGDIFGDLFEEAFGGGRRRTRGQPGHDLRIDKEITLHEVLTGVDVTLDVPNYQTCEVCSGSGSRPGSSMKKCPDCGGKGQVRISHGFFTMAQTCSRCRGFGEIIEHLCSSCSGSGRIHRNRKVKVRVPPGVENGTTLRVNGAGEAGERGAPAGDLFVVVRVAEDTRFERDGANLILDHSISFPLAALGGEVEVESLEGPVRLKIPAGTQPGVHFRISGKGLPQLKSRSRGDLYVRVQVAIPKKLTKEQRKIIQDLAEKTGEENLSKDEGVLRRVFGS